MVVNPDVLLEEMQQIIEAKLSLAGLKISAKSSYPHALSSKTG
jgi:hypothetical protein